ncbi:hypothetical protein [Dehalobacter sp. TeCB1]|uniref:hypothetical protein n=1 Tax=Dehalobacter sp. TeCB1 TaxID=1843715 RepID=UPI00083B9459|nr:hypothetical protein [Dehalobacter sp. TeCB1]OCZ54304.1 hypothetical protein A7D23_05920 [Dehalobacter sp. TeCB1]
MTYYATKIDYDKAIQSNPYADVQLYNSGTQMKAGDYYLGNATGVNLNGATALTGKDRNETNVLFNQQSNNDTLRALLNSSQKDNSDQISQMYEQQKQAELAQLKQAIATNKASQQNIISNAPSQYQPLRDQASYNGYKNLGTLREMLANNGQQGGVNRTEETQVNTATQNDINTLNAQQQQVIDQANKAIADLEASGSLQEAQIVAQNAAEKLQALTAESNRIQEANYQRLKDAISNAQYQQSFNYQADQDSKNYGLQLAQLLGMYNGQPTQAAKEASQNLALNYAQLAAAKSSSGSSGTSLTQTQKSNNATASALSELQAAVDAGYSRAQIQSQIQQNMSSLVAGGVNMTTINNWLEGIQTSDEQQAAATATNQKAWDESSPLYKLTHGTMFGGLFGN